MSNTCGECAHPLYFDNERLRAEVARLTKAAERTRTEKVAPEMLVALKGQCAQCESFGAVDKYQCDHYCDIGAAIRAAEEG